MYVPVGAVLLVTLRVGVTLPPDGIKGPVPVLNENESCPELSVADTKTLLEKPFMLVNVNAAEQLFPCATLIVVDKKDTEKSVIFSVTVDVTMSLDAGDAVMDNV